MRIWPDMPMTAMPRGFSFQKGKRYAVIMAKTEYALEEGVLGPGPEALDEAVKILLDADDPAGDPAAGLIKASEQAPTRPKADVLLMGSAYAPRGEPVAGVRTLLRVTRSSGEVVVNKEIDVVGDRIWLADGTRSAIEPFTKMPLGWDRAFGGPGDAWNPAGRGRRGNELPNLEVPDEPVATRDAKTRPICYGAINPAWRPRRDKLGSYGPDYIEKHWPWLPGDFDWSHFNAAQEDQQVEGFLRGDETIELRHLHPEHEEFKTRLPGERCRAFALIRGRDGSEEFREIELVMDTLTILPDEGKVAVCWRGQTEARSLKLLEFEQLMLVREKLGEPDKGLAHFRQRLQRCIDKPHEVFLPPTIAEDINDAMQTAENAKADAEAARVDGEAKAAEAMKKVEEQRETLKEQGIELPEPPEQEVPPSRYDIVNDAVAMLDRGIAMIREISGTQGAEQIAELEQKKVELENARPALKAEHPRPTRDELEAAARAGEPMHNRDLSHVDFRGARLAGLDLAGSLLDHTDFTDADLSNATFRACMMVSTKLRGATLHGADFRGATVVEVDFDGADLSGTNLAKVSLVGSTLKSTRFVEARLEEALLIDLDLNGVDFTRCEGSRALLFGSKLAGATFDHADLRSAILMNASLEDASFFAADLRKATFCGVKAARASFVASDMQRANLNLKADFTKADFRLIQGANATFQSSTLDDAWLGGADLTRATIAEASLRGTEFVCVHAPGSDFSDAILEDTDMTYSNLFRCVFDRAEITRVHLEGASLFQSGFCETVFDTVYLADTNLKRTMLERPSSAAPDGGKGDA